ncbi:MAG TPA: hypothetical protein VK112_04330, partial [Fodinibius sp.]|nr:hypothetical protein [Fodinibius sp.]
GVALDIFTYIRINDSLTLQTSLDSGAGSGVFRINAKYMAMLGVDSTKTRKSYNQSSFKPDEGNKFYKTELDKMALYKFPQIKIEDFKVTFVNGLIYDAIVPLGWLGKQITIDLANEEMIVQ